MLPTRPASGLTCPSFVFVPQAQHALQTPSQQAQAAQHASEATQPIFFYSFSAYARRRRRAKCGLFWCDVLEPHGCVLLAEEVLAIWDLVPGGALRSSNVARLAAPLKTATAFGFV